MDLFKNVERIRIMLLETCGCSVEDAIIVCEKTKVILEHMAHRKKEQNKYNEQLKELKKMEEESKDVKGYKITRFKKPHLPNEEKRVYQRVCRRCDDLYRTTSKYSWFCDKCKLNSVSNQVHGKAKYQK
jgi:hypothetical protein